MTAIDVPPEVDYLKVVHRRIQDRATARATIACVIPAYNEEDTIISVLSALLKQTRLPDVIHVVVNNSDDETFYLAREFAGAHEHTYQDVTYRTEVFVHDIGVNTDKKVGALNYGFSQVCNDFDYFLGVDGDTVVDKHAVQYLEEEILSDPRVGGVSAIYTVAEPKAKGFMAKFLAAGQRAQFAAFNMDNLVRGRNMAVLGGQCSILSMEALRNVLVENRQATPWVKDSEVEDSLVSLQIKNIGYATKISARARASVGGMDTLRSLDGQQVKWNYGAIDLMWPGQRSNTAGQPFHPNLRLRWSENVSMLFNIVTRISFIILLCASLSIDAYVFYPVWLIPPLVAVVLNLRIALSVSKRSPRDIAFALLAVPAEIYLWLRMGHFVRAWAKFFTSHQTDNWAAQARAERGAGYAYLMPAVVAVIIGAGLVYAWAQLPVQLQSDILAIGWPVLYITTMVQTAFMLRKALRRHRGFRV
ncbi:glycosyltransferase family 2 protein [Arthrobacter sp. ATA002]|uniref:glycosyltransferase family 2 protein n=1 Tax=Arthrobacter sp. ATA002 TaxID=2991715 RepID=UPI0022A7DF9D|nr:glycosyltransferase family 2 protein [Arthrobacter sp. ATA002]WAP50421.1 glycosyltransferase family 2 protein [Arthrobacter sp. ATA002]